MRILLAAGASVAVYKACDLASKLTQAGDQVRAILTRRAARLISPQLFEAVTGEPAFVDEFGRGRKSAMDHIELARFGELLVVAPCTADLLARLALGLGDDLVCTLNLALPQRVPRVLCPAMNPEMLVSPPLRRNLERLIEDGWRVMEPGNGHMACGVAGKGRMPEPAEIEALIAGLRSS